MALIGGESFHSLCLHLRRFLTIIFCGKGLLIRHTSLKDQFSALFGQGLLLKREDIDSCFLFFEVTELTKVLFQFITPILLMLFVLKIFNCFFVFAQSFRIKVRLFIFGFRRRY